MAKSNKPFFSLGARGTVGDTITARSMRGATILEKKPIPSDRRTIFQVYQRWDYQDYIYQWHQLSQAEKQAYNSLAVPYHMTGFAYFMKLKLQDLSDLGGRWHLDEASGNLVYDTSRNTNTGTIFGASPATGLIGGCLSFDGVNDYINCGSHASLAPTTGLTIECHFKPTSDNIGSSRYLIDTARNIEGYSLLRDNTLFLFRFWKAWAPFKSAVILHGNTDIGKWTHLLGSWDGINMRIYWDGELKQTTPCNELPPLRNVFCVGARTETFSYNFAGLIDEVRCYNRGLDGTEAKTHSGRSYP